MTFAISDRIKNLREMNGMTQTELANKLGISRGAVNSWEMSLSTPTVANIIQLSKIFHVTTDYLLGITDNVYLDISVLGEEEQKAVMNIVECLKRNKSLH